MNPGANPDLLGNNLPFTVTRPPRQPFEQIRIVARKAADAAWFAGRKIKTHRPDARLDMVQCEVISSTDETKGNSPRGRPSSAG